VMYGSIPGFPCTTGLVCFGDVGAGKGKCAPNSCTTISWNTSTSSGGCTTADQNPPGGQCRHQQVCVVGYGATLSCIAGCSVSCGGSSTLQACVNGPMNRGPYTLTLTGDDGSKQTQSTLGDVSGSVCLNFNVSPAKSPKTTYTITVADKDSCLRTATTSLDVRTQPTAYAGADVAKCSAGTTTAFKLDGVATNGTPVWRVVSGPVTIADTTSLTSGVTFTGTGTATLRLVVTNSPCPSASDDVILTVNSNPTADAGVDQAKCSGGATTTFTLAGKATAGTGTWSVVSGPVTLDDASKPNATATFTGAGSALLRFTVASNANPACTSVTDDVTLDVTATIVTITPSSSIACNGVITYTASVNGGSGCGFTWTIDGQSPTVFAGNGGTDDARVARTSGTGDATLEFRALDGACHTIAATASCPTTFGTCTGSATTTASECVGVTPGCK